MGDRRRQRRRGWVGRRFCRGGLFQRERPAGTSFQLPGSAIPGELLDNNPGGLIHSALNTKSGAIRLSHCQPDEYGSQCQPVSQGDPRWASDPYANSAFTIQQKGCALSCLAMALNYAGVPTNPGALNTLMNNHGDFVGTGVNWDAATRDASGDTLEFHAYRTADIQYLSQMLAKGYPVIVGVNLNAQGEPGHFVLGGGSAERPIPDQRSRTCGCDHLELL